MKSISSKALFSSFLVAVSMVGFAQGPGTHLNFDGTSSYVDCDTMNLNGSALTMTTWVKVDAFKSTFPYISSLMGTEATGSSALLRIGDATVPNDILQFVLLIGNTYYKVEATTPLTTNKWYHIAATYDGSTMKIYINGLLDASLAVTGNIVSNDVFALGRNYGNDRVLDGQMDESAVWLTALPEATIRDWMCKKIVSSHPNYADLEAYYQYEDGTGSSLTDISGNGHTGTFSGSPVWQTSSAPVGDESAHAYTAPFLASLNGLGFGSLNVATTATNAQAVHVYRVDGQPNVTSLPNGVDIAEQHYWGVFAFGNGTNPVDYALTYNYAGSPILPPSQGCNGTLIRRSTNASTSWAQTGASNNETLSLLSLSGLGRAEYWLARNDSFELQTSGPLEFCNGDSVILFPSNLVGFSGSNISWFKDSAEITGATDSVLTVFESGEYFASIVLPSGCVMNYLASEISVSPGAVEMAPFGPFCDNQEGQDLTIGSPSPGTYTINGETGYTFDPEELGTGIHHVVYTAIDISTGCKDSAFLDVEVLAATPAQLLFTENVCTNEEPFALTEGTPAGGSYSGPGVANGIFDPLSVAPGLHQVSYVYTNAAGCSDTAVADLNLVQAPDVPVITLSNGELVSSESFGNQWYLDNNPISGAIGKYFVPIANGVYKVKVTNSEGCFEFSDTLEFTAVGIGEGSADAACSVFPNPATESIHIRFADGVQLSSITILNQLGEEVINGEFKTQEGLHEVSVSALAPGVYFLQIATENAGQLMQKIVIR